jgi:sugar/nucleoside kinase (ribokinase family)
MPVLIVGSVALDNVKTPVEERGDLLGGSASYGAVAASFFETPQLVGVVGMDFPRTHIDYLKSRKIDLTGLQQVEGETFRWSGEYMPDMNQRQTLSVALNVFEHFNPTLPEGYRQTPYVLLGNIAPSLQSRVLDQIVKPRFVVADTMDLWITVARHDLEGLLKRIDMVVLNDSEAKLLTDNNNLIKAAHQIRKMGPKYVCIKKGEHGALLFGDPGAGEFFSCPSFPVTNLVDPTGAGDCFAGGLAGHLARGDQPVVKFAELRQAVVYGSVLASYAVESFSFERLRKLRPAEIEARYAEFQRISQF